MRIGIAALLSLLYINCFASDELIAAVLIGEAGGESDYRSMSAVYEVICNRSKQRNLTKIEVVLQHKQFSCLNNITTNELIKKAKKHPRWSKALRIVIQSPTNYTLGSNHYCHINSNPYWTRGKKPVITIGNHKFFKL